MNAEQAREIVFAVLRQITPEADFEELEPDVEFREQLDIDSMDFLNLITSLHKRYGIPIPQSDYARLASFADAIAYLLEKTRHSK